MWYTLAIYISSVLVGSIIWGLRLEGRVNTIDQLEKQKSEDLKELFNTRFNAMDQRLERIERSLNGSLYGQRH